MQVSVAVCVGGWGEVEIIPSKLSPACVKWGWPTGVVRCFPFLSPSHLFLDLVFTPGPRPPCLSVLGSMSGAVSDNGPCRFLSLICS